MKRPIVIRLCFAVLASAAIAARAQTTLGTGFTYQGQLKQGGAPANGTVNLRFSLWDAAGSGTPPAGGNQVGGNQLLTNVPIAGGLFTVTLNDAAQFGASAFNGQARWLQVEVCSDANCTAHTTLSPRQSVSLSPFAAFSAGPWITSGGDISYAAGNASIGTNSTTAGLQIRHEPTTPSGTLALEGTTHAYIAFFPDGFANGRKGFLGFPCSTCNDMSITNQITNGGVSLAAGSGGSINLGAGPSLTVAGNGRVGIGTTSPAAAVDVRGDVKLGSSGQYFASGGEENLRIVRGQVNSNGTILRGGDFAVSQTSTAVYTITFNTPFAAPPTVTVTAQFLRVAAIDSVTTASVVISTWDLIVMRDTTPFHFIAIGPR